MPSEAYYQGAIESHIKDFSRHINNQNQVGQLRMLVRDFQRMQEALEAIQDHPELAQTIANRTLDQVLGDQNTLENFLKESA